MTDPDNINELRQLLGDYHETVVEEQEAASKADQLRTELEDNGIDPDAQTIESALLVKDYRECGWIGKGYVEDKYRAQTQADNHRCIDEAPECNHWWCSHGYCMHCRKPRPKPSTEEK